jgi:TonB family protein
VKNNVKGAALVLLVVALLVLAVAVSFAADPPPLTDVSLIIGRAPADQATPAPIPAGTVVVLGDGDEGIGKVTAELREVYRLDMVSTVAGKAARLKPGETLEMAWTPAALRVAVTLLAESGGTPTYKVRLEEAGKLIAEPTVSLRGRRGVIGGSNGPAAPYVFVLLRKMADEPKRVEGDITGPVLLQRVNPTYPEAARKERVMGVVVVEVSLDETGAVRDVRVVESPHEALAQASTDAVRQWRFDPARNPAGKAVAVNWKVTLAFKLQ